jgi:hypothetical protein
LVTAPTDLPLLWPSKTDVADSWFGAADLARLRRANPGKAVEVWAEDEARLGPKPVTRRCRRLARNLPTVKGAIGFRWAAGLEE